MKVIIQIPCYNEENALPGTLAELPRELPGVDTVEWLIIDDGSRDRTVQVARQHGVDHVVQHSTNRGLASAFQSGLDASLRLGADVIVNTDGDNQYPGRFIADLVAPIVEGQADMVIGERPIARIAHFSRSKKFLQNLGSNVVRYMSGLDVPDAPSGFRALSREAALRINVLTGYTYTLETLIQAGKKRLTVQYVPVEVNEKTRESRLMRSTFQYVRRSAATLLRLFLLYEPLRTFTYLSIPFFLVGIALWGRFLILLLTDQAARGSNVQSLLLGLAAIVIGVLTFMLGMLGDIIATNRRLHEETLYLLRKSAYSQQPETPEAETEGEPFLDVAR